MTEYGNGGNQQVTQESSQGDYQNQNQNQEQGYADYGQPQDQAQNQEQGYADYGQPQDQAQRQTDPNNQNPQQPETVSVKWTDGNEYQVPAALQNGLMRHEQYLQAQNELNNHRTQFMQEQQQQQSQLMLQQELVQFDVQGQGLERQLEELNDIDIKELWTTDPELAQEYQNDVTSIQNDLNAINQHKAELEESWSGLAQQHREAELSQIFDYIPEFNQQLESDIWAFSQSTLGMDEQELQSISSPRIIAALNMAMRYTNGLGINTLQPTQTPAASQSQQSQGGSSISDWMDSRNKQVNR